MPVTKRRIPWEDRFTRPGEPEIVAHYDRQTRATFAAARRALGGMPGVSERVAWIGIPWRWSFTYHRQGRTVAYLVPLPASPRLVMTVPSEVAPVLKVGRVDRSTREALAQAIRVADTVWCHLDIRSRSQIPQAIALADAVAAAEQRALVTA